MSKPKSKQKQIQECLDTLGELLNEKGTPALVIAPYGKDMMFRYIVEDDKLFSMAMEAAEDESESGYSFKTMFLSIASNIIMRDEGLKRIFSDMINGTKYEEILSGVDKSLLN